MSWIGVMIGVGVGAAAGGIQSGVNGGDAGDILTGMAIGGGLGGVTGGVGSALGGPAGGAAAESTAESGGASTAGSSLTPTALGITSDVGADAATTSATTGTTGTLGSGGLNALNSSFTGGSLGLTDTIGSSGGVSSGGLGSLNAAGGSTAGTAGVNSAFPTTVANMATNGATNTAGTTVANVATNGAANTTELGFGQGALNTGLNAVNITNPVAQNMIYGGLKGAAIGAGVGGLGSALTGQDIGKGMEGGALTGAIGGIGGAGLSGLTGSSNATLSDIGDFATKHDTLVPAGISLAATPFVNNALAPSMPTTQGSTYSTPLHWAGPKPGVFNQTTYSPDIPNPASFYPTSSGYAEGGITNLAAGGMPKYAPAGLPAGLPEGLPSKIQHLAPKGHPANTRYSHSTGMAQGGIADLGSYKSGGSPNLLHGPGDGVSDDIPATIANKQPARLATGEYVLSSRIVSELGNGSTDAGAKRLDEMVKHIQAGRKKTIGKNKEYAKDTKAYKHLLA